MQKITPCLWFDSNAEEAANYYVSIFKNSKINRVTHYDQASAEVSGKPEGSVLTVEFTIDGHDFVVMNGGPEFKFSMATSFMIDCKTQEEVDHFWQKLSEDGGKTSQCGWTMDKFGVTWQVVPTVLNDLLVDPDKEKAARVMKAMLTMTKLDIAQLEAAARG
jgi:predicted 3-demethylubiquinone-9 3-methyltransferase (glyoxalase superfamily)